MAVRRAVGAATGPVLAGSGSGSGRRRACARLHCLPVPQCVLRCAAARTYGVAVGTGDARKKKNTDVKVTGRQNDPLSIIKC